MQISGELQEIQFLLHSKNTCKGTSFSHNVKEETRVGNPK